MKNNDELYVIKELPILQYLAGVLLVGWIIFAIYMFNINPVFFGFTIFLAIFFSLFLSSTSIEANKDVLKIKDNRVIGIFSTVKEIKYEFITDIDYQKSKADYFVILLSYIFYNFSYTREGRDSAKILIKLQKGDNVEIVAVGSSYNNEGLVKFVKGKIC